VRVDPRETKRNHRRGLRSGDETNAPYCRDRTCKTPSARRQRRCDRYVRVGVAAEGPEGEAAEVRNSRARHIRGFLRSIVRATFGTEDAFGRLTFRSRPRFSSRGGRTANSNCRKRPRQAREMTRNEISKRISRGSRQRSLVHCAATSAIRWTIIRNPRDPRSPHGLTL